MEDVVTPLFAYLCRELPGAEPLPEELGRLIQSRWPITIKSAHIPTFIAIDTGEFANAMIVLDTCRGPQTVTESLLHELCEFLAATIEWTLLVDGEIPAYRFHGWQHEAAKDVTDMMLRRWRTFDTKDVAVRFRPTLADAWRKGRASLPELKPIDPEIVI